jgi:hypothetical protein
MQSLYRVCFFVDSSSQKRKSNSAQVLNLQEKKMKLFEEHQRMKMKEDANYPNMHFVKSLLPEMQKAKDAFGLQMKIMETIKTFLATEKTFLSNEAFEYVVEEM